MVNTFPEYVRVILVLDRRGNLARNEVNPAEFEGELSNLERTAFTVGADIVYLRREGDTEIYDKIRDVIQAPEGDKIVRRLTYGVKKDGD